MKDSEQFNNVRMTSYDYKDMIGNLIERFSKEGDVVYDPMAGIGVHLYVGQRKSRKVVGVDIDEQYENEELGIQHGDSSDTNFPDEAFDLAITSFNPYGEPTSDAERAAANLETLNEYMNMVDGITSETHRVLVRGSYFINISSTDRQHINRCHHIFKRHFDFKGMKTIESEQDLVMAKEPKKVVVMLYRKPKSGD